MRMFKTEKIFVRFAILLVLLVGDQFANAQTSCPPNIDFEQGNTNNWIFYTGTCCPISTPNLSVGAMINRHTLTFGTTNDQYGGFPIVAPGGGQYSLKLGNNSTGAQAERARYYVRVPSGLNNYSLIYRYAVVLQNPNHQAADQPRFEVKVFDSATGAALPCGQFNYVSSSSLPGFALSTVGSQVYYKSWSTASIDLSGQGGKTIAVDFASGDCDLSGHFGYGYLDLNCSLFQIVSVNCTGAPTTTLTAPPGFQTYQWYNSGYTLVGTGQTVNVATPAITSQYFVVLTPYTGYGCPDTLATTISVSSLNVKATNDTFVCNGNSIQLRAGATGTSTSFNYSWTPSTGLSCTNCANPSANPSVNTTYFLTVTDGNNCIKKDTVKLEVGPIAIATSGNVSCYNGNNGNASVAATQGRLPYTYTWTTTPIQNTNSINNLSAGAYNVFVTDANGCTDTASVLIAQPPPVLATINHTNVSCFGGNNATATVIASGGTPPYSYSWNTFPVQTTAAISNLSAGIFIATVTDSKGCIALDTVVITQPTVLNATIASATNVSCNGGSNGSATTGVSGGTTPYSYAWNTLPQQTSLAATGLAAGTYIVTVTDSNGCSDTGHVLIAQPPTLVASVIATNVDCFGNASGSATVFPTGGTTPYFYTWNTSPTQTTVTATNLFSGTYYVTIADSNGCTTIDTTTIIQPSAPLNASISSVIQPLCYGGNNGSASAFATGGTLPYSYTWNTTPLQTTATAVNLSLGSYTVVVSDNKGCLDSIVATVLQPDSLSLTLKTSDVNCFGGNTGSATVSVAGGTSPYTYLWNTSPPQTASAVNNLISTIYGLTVTDYNGCIKSTSVNIAQPTILNVTINNATNVSCNGGNNGSASAIVTAGTAPYTYTWNTLPAQNTQIANNLAAGIYILTVTDAKGCIATDTVIITQPQALTANISSTPVLCFGTNTGSASVTASGGMSPYSYSWNTTPIQTTAVAGNLTAGNYSITITDNLGCTAGANISVVQPSQLSATIASITNVSCNGGSNGSAMASVSGGTPGYSYSWNTTPAQNTPVATGLSAGNYIVTATDSKGCTDTASVTIVQPTILSASLNSTGTTCFGGSNGSATISASGGTIPYTYSWNTTPPQTGVTATNLSAGNYTATITDSKGCTTNANVSVAQPTQLIASISGKTDITCFGLNNGTANAIANGGTPPHVFAWNTTPIQNVSNATGLSQGTFNVTVTDNNGCSAITNVTINNAPPIIVTMNNVTASKCFGGNDGSATVSVTGGAQPYSFSWNTSPVQTTATASNLAAGSYIVTVTDSNGCTKKDTVQINQPSDLIVNPGFKPTCIGMSEGIAYSSVTGGLPPYSLSWSNGQLTDTIKQLPAGNYSVTVTDANNCSKNANVVIPNHQSPIVNAGNDKKLCRGSSVQLQATGATNYYWQPPTGLSCTNCANPFVQVNSDISYTVVGTNEYNCSDTDDISITVANRVPTSVGEQIEICEGEEANLFASGGIAYYWTPSINLSNNEIPNPTARPAVTTSYKVVITENECYKDTLEQMVIVHPLPTINLGTDINAIAGAQMELNAQTTNATSIIWTPPINLNCSDCFNPIATFLETITYVATVTNELGCQASDKINITVGCDNSALFIPNTFTPNGDGNNDAFFASGKGIAILKKFIIYNRWGQRVFEAINIPPNDERLGWDGTFKNDRLPTDVFVYMIEAACTTGETITLKGDVTLLR
ncbi:MAG TPA: gliding motility-associated C-terminal domain-containing protein [Flavipsychrobacter sp.]|nr:gliding motility-associated C-terminal domain-containing protein [Flavipsychrobacter sp.]